MYKQYLISVILLFSVSTYVLSKPTSSSSTDTDMSYIKVCNETSPISLITMNEVLINKKLSGKESNDFKCFLHCLFTKYGWMDEDGGFFLSEMKHVLEETLIEISLLEFILYRCTASSSVDRCERASFFTECFWDKVKEHHLDEEETYMSYNLDDRK